jgi:hypothetical protein
LEPMPMPGMVVFLPYFQCFNHLVGGLIQVLIFTCVLMSLYFLLTNCSKVLTFWWGTGHMLLSVVIVR